MKYLSKTFYYLSTHSLVILISIILFFIFSFKHSYITFTKEEPIAILSFEKLQNQKYLATLYTQENHKQPMNYIIYGDQWRLDSYFKKFKYYANMLNINNKYSLDRIEGRYIKVSDQNNKKNYSYDLNKMKNNIFLNNTFLENIFIDTEYGSSVFKKIEENKIYKIYKTNTGLITREEKIEVLNSSKKKSQNKINPIINYFFK